MNPTMASRPFNSFHHEKSVEHKSRLLCRAATLAFAHGFFQKAE
jgi:hypothetical protein